MMLPLRWTVERALGWLMHHRRLAHDYEALPALSTAIIYLAMIALMARRFTRNPGEDPDASSKLCLRKKHQDKMSPYSPSGTARVTRVPSA
ncbi:transposase [Streptomyces sp. BH-SS-21]|uniref:Transposase n=1 Tax=Streptomyces liliiviolaceus TaxID=2823109 RepID=A0A940XYI1_9ACTN|nr:transposase [Streptomyces liliiviolaceus]